MSGNDLIDASRKGDLEKVKKILAENTSVDSDGHWRATSLVNYQNERGETALISAAWYGHLEVVQILIKAGTNVNLQTADGYTALMMSALMGHLEIVRALIKAGANVNLRSGFEGTALICAARGGYLEIVQILFQAGANINHQNIQGETALTWTVWHNHLETFRFLIQSGADINIQNKCGRTIFNIHQTDEIKNFITKYPIIKENIKKLDDLRENRSTYCSIIPTDIIFLVKNQLSDEIFYL